ncbi:hypothetical protein V490_04928 [Pseudogymnoascus sp. VKM F-3557]|nr:hypothetical protein V490_04928 [Pseudogymnoascus sp. VKM F-3557]
MKLSLTREKDDTHPVKLNDSAQRSPEPLLLLRRPRREHSALACQGLLTTLAMVDIVELYTDNTSPLAARENGYELGGNSRAP